MEAIVGIVQSPHYSSEKRVLKGDKKKYHLRASSSFHNISASTHSSIIIYFNENEMKEPLRRAALIMSDPRDDDARKFAKFCD